ncbi:hypothetical protein IPA_09505 [Ignicoccus pacificus DSM 13166]|uniref:Digeranylgeranylglycerophospholipid reductase catalytic domain-containing protein n=1 Tax=Ignicoccus pacificus DSM 13166 TaxID=940294 RepID=A0A977PKI7_9CREN|nr:hypothetical protein IPA_09505 [Ignicoccus pacificus DSM 13166]
MEVYFEDKRLGRWDSGRKIFFLVDRTKYLEEYLNNDLIELKLSTAVKIRNNDEFLVEDKKLEKEKVIVATGVTWRLKERDMVANTIQYIMEGVKIDEVHTMKFLFYQGLVGYAWIFPLSENSVKVGIGGINVSVDELENKLNSIIKKYKLEGKVVKREGAPIDMGGLKPEWGGGPPYAIGEAIGAVMPLTGEGIRPSIITAHALATALTKNNNYKKILSGLGIYKASKLQRKILERVLKQGAELPFKDKELSPKTIEAIYKLGMGELGLRDLLSLASKLPSLLRGII